MRLNELRLENYKIFYGKNSLKFDRGKIFVIEGRNGYGKSTLVDSIFFALYGKGAENIINDYALQRGENFCKVALDFSHNGNNYFVERKLENGKQKFSLLVNGSETSAEPESILPEKAAKFYFFDCEKFAQVLEPMTSAVETVWEIDSLRAAKSDLEKLKQKLELSLSKLDKIKKKLRKIFFRDVDRAELRKLEKQVAQAQLKIKALASELARTEKLLAACEFVQLELKFKKEFSALILQDLVEQAVKIVVRRKDDWLKARLKQGRLSAQRELVEKILAEHRCICGSAISTSHYGKHELRELLASLKQEEARQELIPSEVYGQSINELNLALGRVRNIETKPDRLEKTRHELEYVQEARNLDLEEAKLKQKLDKLNLEKRVWELRAIEVEQEYKALAEKLRKARLHKPKKATLLKLKKIALLSSALDELIDLTAQEHKLKVRKKASSALKKLTNKPKEYAGIEFQADYSLAVSGGDLKRFSDGEKQVVTLSFIAGLENELIVIDAPFTRLDKLHKQKLVKNLGKFADQLILLVTDEDSKAIKGLAQRSWQIKHEQATRSSWIKCL